MAKYIEDNNKVQEILEQWQTSSGIKYCKVDSVKIRNKITKCQDIVKDIFFVALYNNSDKPAIVCSIYDSTDDIHYISHRDITHWNTCPSLDGYNFSIGRKQYKMYFRKFCNPVLNKHIMDNPDRASKILKGNLMEGNPNDRWRTPDSVDVDKKVQPLIDRRSGQLIKNSAGLDVFFFNSYTKPNDIDQLREFNGICKKLKENHDLRYCLYASSNSYEPMFSKGLIDKDDINSGKYIVSNYYKSYSYRNVGDITEIPKAEYDVCCVGCGSAGSNILDQMIRLNYFEKGYVLIDFDNVETKNLRNQMFNRGSVGSYKATALQRILQNIRNVPVWSYNQKYEEFPFENYKFNYIISGFDSIECRLGLLEKILSKEIESKYLIDARYNDLDASLFMVDLANEEEIKYYHKLLLQDLEEFNKNKIEYYPATEWDEASIRALDKETKLLTQGCSTVGHTVTGEYENICEQLKHRQEPEGCGSTKCIECIKKFFIEHDYKVPAKYKQENSCLAENIIHIYKLVSSWVTANVRSIETDNKKLFTHVDITAEPLPRAMVLRK